MSKPAKPPPDKILKQQGIRFVPTNCYSPNHWTVSHVMFPFDGFDTRSEAQARLKASLANQLGAVLAANDLLNQKDILIPAIFRLLKFDNS